MRKLSVLGPVLLLLGLLWPASSSAQTYRVGLQAGHWRSSEFPDELKSLRGNTGAAAGGVTEVQVNLDVTQRAAGNLRGMGVAVDVLPATVPINYRADAFVAIHADGSASSRSTGFKISTHWREWEPGTALVAALRSDYGAASGLVWDGARITSGMRGYYAFSSGRYDHAISNNTPGVILEMGYLTNPNDRRLMTAGVDRLARAVANGVMRFLRSKPATGWPVPPPLPEYRATITSASANLRSGPGSSFQIVRNVARGRTMMIAEVRGEWLRLLSFRSGNGNRWVHRDNVRMVRLSEEPPQDS